MCGTDVDQNYPHANTFSADTQYYVKFKTIHWFWKSNVWMFRKMNKYSFTSNLRFPVV